MRTFGLELVTGLVFGVLLFGSSFLGPFVYPNVGEDVLRFTFWGFIIAVCVQLAKVLNSIFEMGILLSGGDIEYILRGHVMGSYAIGIPAAIFSGFCPTPCYKNALTLLLIEQAGAEGLFLPAYSPDLNPIEKMWSKIKETLRSTQARTQPDLLRAIASAFESVSSRGHELVCLMWLQFYLKCSKSA